MQGFGGMKHNIDAIDLSVAFAGVPSAVGLEGPTGLHNPQDQAKKITHQ